MKNYNTDVLIVGAGPAGMAAALELSKLEGVLSVSMMAGQYDLMIELLVDSNKGLMHFITEVLSGVKGIAKSETLVTLKSYNKFI